MNGFGPRLREERERLGMTQRVFGDIGGVEPNAQVLAEWLEDELERRGPGSSPVCYAT